MILFLRRIPIPHSQIPYHMTGRKFHEVFESLNSYAIWNCTSVCSNISEQESSSAAILTADKSEMLFMKLHLILPKMLHFNSIVLLGY